MIYIELLFGNSYSYLQPYGEETNTQLLLIYLLLGFSAFFLVTLLLSLVYVTLADDDKIVTITTEDDDDDTSEDIVTRIGMYGAYYIQFLLSLPYTVIQLYKAGGGGQYITVK